MDNYDKVQIWNSKKENMACVLCSRVAIVVAHKLLTQ